MCNSISILNLFKSSNVQQLAPTNLKTVSKVAAEENSLLSKTNNHQMDVREMASAITEVKNSNNETAALESQAKTMIKMMDSYLKKGKTNIATAPFIVFKKIVDGEIDVVKNPNFSTIVKGPDGVSVLVEFVKQNDGYTKVTATQGSLNDLEDLLKGKTTSVKLKSVDYSFNTKLIENLPEYYNKYHQN